MSSPYSSSDLFRRLLGFLTPYKGRLSIAIVCMIILAACTAAMAWMLKPVLDQALSGKNEQLIYVIPGLIILLYLIKGAAYFGQAYTMGYIGQKVIFDLRNLLYHRLSFQSLAFFAHRKTGELLARLSYDVTLVQSAVSTAVTALMRDAISIVFLVGVVFVQDWMLALITMLVFPAVIYPIARFGRKMRHATLDGQAAMGDLTSLLEETVGGIRVVKAFGMEEYEQSRFRKLTGDFFAHQLSVFRVNALSFPIMELLAGFGIAGVLLYGGMRVASGETTAGTLVSFLAAVIMLYEPVKRLSRANNDIQQGLAASQRIFELLDEPIEVEDHQQAHVLPPFSNAIRFEHVGLQYSGTDKTVLNDINFTIAAGEVVALVGRSGAGKTSLVNLLPRFMDVTEGHVLIDDMDVRDLTQASLRSQIALVTQEFIEKLPQGYDTLIGERGAILSGGQRQRLSMARALLKDAPILILDEATSALDTESERLVQRAIDRLMKGRTVMVIAHRLSTIRHADRIVVLDQGHIAQMGRHEELLAEGGLYAELYQLQFESRFQDSGIEDDIEYKPESEPETKTEADS